MGGRDLPSLDRIVAKNIVNYYQFTPCALTNWQSSKKLEE
jgi:hypothetical protein